MTHRRTLSVIQTMKLEEAKERDIGVGVGMGVGAGLTAIRVLSAAATALAPTIPLSAMRSSMSFDSSTTTTLNNDNDVDKYNDSNEIDDCMSMSSLDLLHPHPPSPSTPGTPSKLFPHPPHFPSYAAEQSASGALTKAQYTLRRFVSRVLATLSPRAPLGLPLKSSHLTPASSASYLASLPTRQHAPIRRRATFLALLALIALCIWTLFNASVDGQLSRSYGFGSSSSEGTRRNWKDWRNKAVSQNSDDERSRLMNSASFRAASSEIPSLQKSKPVDSSAQQHPGSRLEMSPPDELAALTAFIAALPWNALPSHVDASHAPLDPTIILDFDPSHPRARNELAELRRETWVLNPVVLYGRSRHAPTREVRKALEKLGVDVKAGIMDVEVNERVDGEIVRGALGRLVPSLEDTAKTPATPVDLPLLLIAGKPIRGADVPTLVESGELARMLKDAGARMAVPGKTGKKKVH